jgi:hypothetical protein
MKTQATRLYPFVPSGADFARSLEFFTALGFEREWQQEGLAGLRFGGAYFMLQDINVPVWQENQMLTYEVTDLAGDWSELAAGNLESKFAGEKLHPPTDFPWGREIQIIDPAGVRWHVREARE